MSRRSISGWILHSSHQSLFILFYLFYFYLYSTYTYCENNIFTDCIIKIIKNKIKNSHKYYINSNTKTLWKYLTVFWKQVVIKVAEKNMTKYDIYKL
jgi:hypothetical protein